MKLDYSVLEVAQEEESVARNNETRECNCSIFYYSQCFDFNRTWKLNNAIVKQLNFAEGVQILYCNSEKRNWEKREK